MTAAAVGVVLASVTLRGRNNRGQCIPSRGGLHVGENDAHAYSCAHLEVPSSPERSAAVGAGTGTMVGAGTGTNVGLPAATLGDGVVGGAARVKVWTLTCGTRRGASSLHGASQQSQPLAAEVFNSTTHRLRGGRSPR